MCFSIMCLKLKWRLLGHYPFFLYTNNLSINIFEFLMQDHNQVIVVRILDIFLTLTTNSLCFLNSF